MNTMNTPINTATFLLEQIARMERGLAQVNARAEAEIDAIRQKYAGQRDAFKAPLSKRAKELTKLCRDHDPDIFGDADVRHLDTGALLKQQIERIVKKRDLLENIDKAGREDLVKIARSVDWDAVEKLTDVELVDLGTERKRSVTYGYDVKEAPNEISKADR